MLPEFVQLSSQHSFAIAVKLSLTKLSDCPCGASIEQYRPNRCLGKLRFISTERSAFNMINSISMAAHANCVWM